MLLCYKHETLLTGYEFDRFDYCDASMNSIEAIEVFTFVICTTFPKNIKKKVHFTIILLYKKSVLFTKFINLPELK